MITITRRFENKGNDVLKTLKEAFKLVEDETLKTGKWRPQDDEKLLEMYKKFPNNWVKISDALIHKESEE